MFTYDDYPYRVFISYSRQDHTSAKKVADRLRELNLEPVWDEDNSGGWSFLDVITKQIDHVHLFVPLLTGESENSSWVNHEIGYAMGRNIPVLPLSLGHLPRGMVAGIQAEVAERIEDLLPRLRCDRIKRLVQKAQAAAVYDCASLAEDRTDAILRHCEEVEGFTFQRAQRLRHRAAFGSFSLPFTAHDPLWEKRYQGQVGQGRSPRRIQRLSEERRRLEDYALKFGCDLVLYPKLSHLSRDATEARLQTLQAFLRKAHDAQAKCRVVFDESALAQNILIVGDWFFAESITPHLDGYRHTIITCHAPTVLREVKEFDTRFHAHDDIMSADRAIVRLDES